MSSVADNQRESLQGPIVVNCQYARARFDRISNQANDELMRENLAPLFPASVDAEENSIRPGEALWTERSSKGTFSDQQPEVFSNLKGILVPKTVLAKGRSGSSPWLDLRRHVDKKVLRFVGFSVQDVVYTPERDGKKSNYGLTSLVSGMTDVLHTGQGLMRPGCLFALRIPMDFNVRQGQRVGVPQGKIVGETYIVEPTDLLPTAKVVSTMLRLTDKDTTQMKEFDVPQDVKSTREDLVALDEFIRHVATVSVLLYQLQNHHAPNAGGVVVAAIPDQAALYAMSMRAQLFGGFLDHKHENNIPAGSGVAAGDPAEFLVKEQVAVLLEMTHLKDARVHKAISHLCIGQHAARGLNASPGFQTCLRNGANTLLTPFADCVHEAVSGIAGRSFGECKPGGMFKANLAPGVIC